MQAHFQNEFILDRSGAALAKDFTQSEYLNSYVMRDGIFHGILDDSILIGTILGITRNRELLAHLIPSDNAARKNINVGAFHFRLWKLGDWYDVVVDDYLPVDTTHNLLFARNLVHANEFWIALFEKAVIK